MISKKLLILLMLVGCAPIKSKPHECEKSVLIILTGDPVKVALPNPTSKIVTSSFNGSTWSPPVELRAQKSSLHKCGKYVVTTDWEGALPGALKGKKSKPHVMTTNWNEGGSKSVTCLTCGNRLIGSSRINFYKTMGHW